MTVHTADDVRAALKAACRPSQREWALANGFSPQFVCDILKGHRAPSENIAKALGFERKVVFLRLQSASELIR